MKCVCIYLYSVTSCELRASEKSERERETERVERAIAHFPKQFRVYLHCDDLLVNWQANGNERRAAVSCGVNERHSGCFAIVTMMIKCFQFPRTIFNVLPWKMKMI